MFKFHINKYSKYPIHEQIKEQVKIALSLGHIGPGYALPSIRDLERELKIGRTIIYRAYRDLASSQILDLQSRRGAIISQRLTSSRSNDVMERCEKLALKIGQEVHKANLLRSAFGNYFYHRAHVEEQLNPVFAYVESIKTEALDCALQISRTWRTNVVGLSCGEFDNLTVSNVSYQWILTPYYDFDKVSRTAKKLKVKVVPLILKYSTAFITELRLHLQKGKVLIIFDRNDFDKHGFELMEEIKSQLPSRQLSRMDYKPFRGPKALLSVARTNKYKRIYVGNRVWEVLSPKAKSLQIIGRPRIALDEKSLEMAKAKIGMIP